MKNIPLEQRLFIDYMENGKVDFCRKIKNMFQVITRAYHDNPRFEEDGNIFRIKPFPGHDIALTYNLDELWNEYVDGEDLAWIEYRFEQNIDRI